DLDAAKKELSASGYAGEEIDFSAPSAYYTNGRLVTDAVNEMWQELGVKVNYQVLDTGKWVEGVLSGKQITSPQSFSTQGDPATSTLTTAWRPGAGQSPYYTAKDDFLALADEAGSSTDVALREKDYRAITAIVDHDTPIAPLYRSVEFYGVRQS